LLEALACGFLVPVVGIVLAVSQHRRVAAWMFTGAFTLSLLAGFASGALLGGSLRSVDHGLAPATPSSMSGAIYCREYSGGESRCPGG
jgi:hypothetical protein